MWMSERFNIRNSDLDTKKNKDQVFFCFSSPSQLYMYICMYTYLPYMNIHILVYLHNVLPLLSIKRVLLTFIGVQVTTSHDTYFGFIVHTLMFLFVHIVYTGFMYYISYI